MTNNTHLIRKKLRFEQTKATPLEVDLKLIPITPPEYLYHGTATRNLGSIKKHGLLKRERHHVHLSEKKDTANA